MSTPKHIVSADQYFIVKSTPDSERATRSVSITRIRHQRMPATYVLICGALAAFLPVSAWAIPSPDIVIGLTASIAQVVGLLSVIIGGAAYSVRGRLSASNGAETGMSKGWRWVLTAAFLLLLFSVCANIFQHVQYDDERNQRLQTNLVRSSTENGERVGDTSLKTLSFSEQVNHPLGVQTETLSRWMQDGRPLNLIDVREDEEVEMGRIAGSSHKRYPDLRLDASDLNRAGHETVLLCYSGNRSSELCMAFAEEGKACRFMIGGYEKWQAEGRSLDLEDGLPPEQLRALAEYRNKTTLLDTSAATEAYTNDAAVFLDVRYPGDFKLGHLPGAINIPVRKLLSKELDVAISALPDKPLVAACYDRRSCFYAKILGLRLTRNGYDYRGRYTTPHEFFVPVGKTGESERWRSANQLPTIVAIAFQPLEAALKYLRNLSGHYVVGILVLVFLLRLVLLPFASKSIRDDRVQKTLEPEIASFKKKFRNEPKRLSRAIMRLYRNNKLTPVRNMLGAGIQLFLFLVFFMVVSRAAKDWPESFLWLDDAVAPDPYFMLPITVSTLFFGFLILTTVKRSLKFLLLYVLGSAVLFWLTYGLSAAVNLYLVMNISLLVVQYLVLDGFIVRSLNDQTTEVTKRSKSQTTVRRAGIVGLKDCPECVGAGRKAGRLGEMLRAGLPVPDGFVLTHAILNRGSVGAKSMSLQLTSDDKTQLRRHLKRLGSGRVAVRSSGLNEDGAKNSYAGVFESVLDVGRDELMTAISRVFSSLNSERTSAYSGKAEQAGVLVQRMIKTEYAGVLFTQHPASTGSCLVELVAGLGDCLVSGQVTPESFRFGRTSGCPLDNEPAPIDLKPLLELGRKVERLFGRPQDIEWGYVKGRFFLLQARDITKSAFEDEGQQATLEEERARLLNLFPVADPQEVLLVQNELSEQLSNPTPISSSLMERLWAAGGSTDISCQLLGIPYDVDEESTPYVTTVFGALYVNRQEERRRLRKGPGMAASFRLARAAEAIESEFRENFLPEFFSEMLMRAAIDLTRLTDDELFMMFESWTDTFVTKTYVQAEIINLATDFYWKTACGKLEANKLDSAVYLGDMPETVVHRAMSLLGHRHRDPSYVREFLELFGHRAPEDYELAQPRYWESPELLLNELSRGVHPTVGSNGRNSLPPDPVLRLIVDRAKRFQVLKEEAKHHCLKQLSDLRKVLVELDHRMGLDGGIFYLTLDEISILRESAATEMLREQIKQRQTRAQSWAGIRLPTELTLVDLERMEPGTGRVPGYSNGSLQGTRVAGRGDVIGRVRVMHNAGEAKNVEKGEIVVARLTDPTWYPLFPVAKGLVTEVGGWLSHAAIVAREYNLTTIVGVRAASEALKTGQLVRLTADGRVEKLDDEQNRNSCSHAA